ncbi:glycoprotein integral membrane protein 1 [Rhinophrynus dorsalis]
MKMVVYTLCSGPSWTFLPGLHFLLLTIISGGQSVPDTQLIQETVRINVTTLHETERVIEQVKFNIGYNRGQININGFPVNRGVTRITCKMDIWDYGNSNEWKKQTHQSLISLRLLVQDWPMNYSSGVARIIVQQEVVSVNGNQVHQNETAEVEFVVNDEMGVLTHSISTTALENTLLFFIPRDNDVLVTLPNVQGTGNMCFHYDTADDSANDNTPQQTTREYSIRQNTTLDEEPFPGKLPETPIRADIPASSYKMMCKLADDLREELCLIWLKCYPVLVDLIEVVIVGVISATIVLEVLKIVYPQGYQKGILHYSDLKDSPVYIPLVLPNAEKVDKSQEAENIL